MQLDIGGMRVTAVDESSDVKAVMLFQMNLKEMDTENANKTMEGFAKTITQFKELVESQPLK
jgi:hypothetical protein